VVQIGACGQCVFRSQVQKKWARNGVPSAKDDDGLRPVSRVRAATDRSMKLAIFRRYTRGIRFIHYRIGTDIAMQNRPRTALIVSAALC
jgi:hypothetical protein